MKNMMVICQLQLSLWTCVTVDDSPKRSSSPARRQERFAVLSGRAEENSMIGKHFVTGEWDSNVYVFALLLHLPSLMEDPKKIEIKH